MLLNDLQITQLATEQEMISPFTSELLREVDNTKIISFGLSSYGYDLRLSKKEFKIFKHIPGEVINPKNFNPEYLESSKLQTDKYGDYFILPSLSYGLGFAVEALKIPSNVTVICLAKSTYARCGVAVNVTPGEAGWYGYLTLEIVNSSKADCRIYANEGIVQLLFFEGKQCKTSYADRNGKYQGQVEQIVLARV